MIRKAFANGLSAHIKLSKMQLSKMVQLRRMGLTDVLAALPPQQNQLQKFQKNGR